jgi:DNA-binding response OmpR family regulator
VHRILLVEDDDAIAMPLQRALTRDGHDVRRTASGVEAVELALVDVVDLVLLDLGLPDLDGLEVCRLVREGGSRVGIIMLTARGDELDRVVGLDGGADDYLMKPFSLAELSARMRSLLRRVGVSGRAAAAPTTAGRLAVPDPAPVSADVQVPVLRVLVGARRVFVRDREVSLTVKEFDLMAALDRRRGDVVTREQLMDEVWDENWFGSTKTLDVTVARLRAKLDEAGGGVTILTARGVGFRLEIDGARVA